MILKNSMETISLTVLFDEPFWIGLFERFDGRKYEVCKVTFGAEPKDYEVYEFILRNWYELKFSPSLSHRTEIERVINPKRLQRKIKNSLQNTGIGTKAQQALKLQHEHLKTERRVQSKEEREAEKERQYRLRQEKKKAKHKGK